MKQRCAWPNCEEEGTFRAPKNPRDLTQKQYFCQSHIKEFNKRWNGLDGFSETEIYSMQDGQGTWNRPTWTMGLNQKPTAGRAEQIFANSEDLYGFFKNRLAEEAGKLPTTHHLPADVKEACAIFSIEQPLEEMLLKKRYLSLVKQHHPDVNKSAEAPEHIKRINVAYRILSDFAQRRGL